MTKKVGSTGRFGARYGKRLKSKALAVEKVQKTKQKCPYCHRQAVKRVATGIWYCKKCDSKFTGRAYRLGE